MASDGSGGGAQQVRERERQKERKGNSRFGGSELMVGHDPKWLTDRTAKKSARINWCKKVTNGATI